MLDDERSESKSRSARSAARNKSYVDLTGGSDSEDEKMASPPTSQKKTAGSKRKRAASAPPASSAEEDGEDELGEEEYEIESIIDARVRWAKGKPSIHFRVHWKGYDSDEDSWTPADQFDDDDPPVLEFYKRNPDKPSKAKLAQKSSGSTSTSTSAKPKANGVAAKAKTTEREDSIIPLETPQGRLASSPAKPRVNGGDLMSFFGGKENRDPAKSAPAKASKATDKAPSNLKLTETKSKAAAPQKKKRKVEEDDSDFAMDEAKAESEDDDLQSFAAESEDDKEDDLESDHSAVIEKPSNAKKGYNGGWGGGGKTKTVKKAAVSIGSYRSGVKPLGQQLDVRNAIKNLSEDLPPISDIEQMFDHLVSRVPDVVKIVERLNGRKLRVATMCSGTESPLLALNMIAKAIKSQHDMTLSFEHVFSCEIEPFKQAYIERNFSPPILFRDVTELGKKRAHTAYGSLVEVPGNVDLLIAGTSCVDYSNLNNQQQDIDANGESGRTFRGMLQWVKKNQPAIVILENVCNAPWDKVVEYFAQIDYDAQHSRLDTKEYYIPHTRTRVYLFATPMKKGGKAEGLSEKWVATVRDMKRPWSTPFEAYLLDTDNPNIHRARLDFTAARDYKDGTSRKATDWNRCESRHQRARQDEQLGYLRPLTSWQEAGVCKGLDWTWNDWLLSQTERVLDLLEISTLRMAKDGVDSGFKACIWNVSQNVDRQTGSGRTALAPCLTPNMIPWVTNRGGPVTGREALALQGIPVRELLLTSETEDQLADLAGNAMTTTVVGSSMLAALKVALDKLAPGEDAERDAAKIEEEIAIEDDLVANRVFGEDSLDTSELDLAKVTTANLTEVLDMAERSSRHCQCEGQSGATSPIDECTDCGYRACKSCGGRPDHHYTPCQNVRVEPGEFEKRFKELLPMRVQIAGLNLDVLSSVRERAEVEGKGTVSAMHWDLWSTAVLKGINNAEFRFRYMKRQFTWTAVYEAPEATLDLFLQGSTPEWRLTIKCPITEPVNSPLRSLLIHPVARLRFDIKGQDVLGGPWELCIPSRQTFKVDVIGRGEQVPSWHSSLGLGGHFEGTKRWSQLEFVLPDDAKKALDRDLSGIYTLLPKCGQAMNSLHKKEPADSDNDLPRLYFFFDPTRCGEAEDDPYVFSTSTERLDFGTERAVIATLDPKWRESAKEQDKANLEVRGGWLRCDEAHMTAVGGSDIAVVKDPKSGPAQLDQATFSVPRSAKSISADLDHDGCQHAMALLSCRVPLDPAHSEDMWRAGAWGEIDLLHQGNATFANLAWITERLPPLDGLSKWNMLSASASEGTACQRCAPLQPKIHWIKRAGKKNKNGGKTKSTIIAFEDKQEAGRYEHALKNRPAPFVVQLRLDKNVGSFRIGLNIVSLAHRALSRLPPNALKGETRLSWRLTPGQVVDVPEPPRVFILPSNKRDPEHAQPKGFKLPLRVEQLRSLWWMLEQEKAEGKKHTFVEEEISEAALPSLGWRAEGKAERPVMIRGGVIADQVGYGKTIISLALVAEASSIPAPEPAPRGLLDCKATLIVVPGHLSKQWPSEISRFTGKMFNVIVIQNMADLKNKSIAELSKADIIVMAAEIFEADTYWERMEYLSGQPEEWLSDKLGGRFFSDRLDTAISSLRTQVATLAADGAPAAYKTMKEAQKKAVEDAESKKEAHKTANFGKRMKGQAYRDRWDGEAGKTKGAAVKEDAELWEAPEEEEEEDEDDSEPIPVPTFRAGKGKEAYSNSGLEDNYKLLACPLLHMFRFRRVIADEFTYLDKRSLAALLRLQSCYKWVLSGTPPVSDFPAIRSIAAFMGIHLGVEDDAEGNASLQKARAKEQTQAEKFHAFREVHSQAWRRRRDDLAQEFLNTFVRQNIAEIDDIPTVEHIHEIKLPASEGAVYLELEHHLQALEMQARKETKFKDVTIGDRNARLEEALADSKTAEEALLKRSCHFTLDLTRKERDAKSAQEACEYISSDRKSQLKGCEDDLYRSINIAVGLHLYVRKKGQYGKGDQERQHFREWVNSVQGSKHNHGDSEAETRLVKVLERCGFVDDGWPTAVADPKATAKVDKKESVDDVKWRLREQTHLLRRLAKELVARVRSLRFFEVVRKLQRNGDEAKHVLEGSACAHKPSTDRNVEMAVLSCCGHLSCHSCMIEAAENQACPMGKDNCQAAVRNTNIVKVKSLGIEGELSSGRYGVKLQKLVDLIHSVPKDQRILVFLQWEDLVPKVSEALNAGKIPHDKLYGSTKSRANTLDKFQTTDSDSARVLLLKINDASAAGSNLTTANHAIFVGPLFTNTLLNYRAVETQAIGRIRRYGQERKVHIHRLLALDTIDVTMFEARRKECEAKPDYEKIPQEEYRGKKRKTTMEVEIVSPAKRKGRPPAAEEPVEID